MREIKKTWKCDSCGVVDETKYSGFSRRIHEPPDGWSELGISLKDDVGLDIESEICPRCTSILYKHTGSSVRGFLYTTSLLFNIRPVLAVDAVVIKDDKVLLIKRKNKPEGWAFAGGFVDPNESAGDAVIRELKEETGLEATAVSFLSFLDDPKRDPRFHVMSLVYYVDEFKGEAKAADDASEVGWFSLSEIPNLEWAFPDHYSIAASLLRNLANLGVNLKGEDNV